MLTSKQRSNLRSIAQKIDPIGQIGKNGLSDNLIESFSQALEKREIIKVTILSNVEDDELSLANELASSLDAELVCKTGHKVVIYKRSSRKDVEHIEF